MSDYSGYEDNNLEEMDSDSSDDEEDYNSQHIQVFFIMIFYIFLSPYVFKLIKNIMPILNLSSMYFYYIVLANAIFISLL